MYIHVLIYIYIYCYYDALDQIRWRPVIGPEAPADPAEVFFSYHWPSWNRLGPDDVQRHAMVHSLHLFAEKNGVHLEHVWVWLAPCLKICLENVSIHSIHPVQICPCTQARSPISCWIFGNILAINRWKAKRACGLPCTFGHMQVAKQLQSNNASSLFHIIASCLISHWHWRDSLKKPQGSDEPNLRSK